MKLRVVRVYKAYLIMHSNIREDVLVHCAYIRIKTHTHAV